MSFLTNPITLQQQKQISHSSGAVKSKTKALVGSGSWGELSPWLAETAFYVLTWFSSVCVCRERNSSLFLLI